VFFVAIPFYNLRKDGSLGEFALPFTAGIKRWGDASGEAEVSKYWNSIAWRRTDFPKGWKNSDQKFQGLEKTETTKYTKKIPRTAFLIKPFVPPQPKRTIFYRIIDNTRPQRERPQYYAAITKGNVNMMRLDSKK